MIVDVHAHYHPRAYHEALARMPGFGGGSGFAAGTQPVTDAEPHIQARLEMMADAGVNLQVLSPAAGWAPYSADLAASTAAATVGNNLTAALAARLPERLKALVSLPLPHLDASLRELRRGLDELGMIGQPRRLGR